MAILLGVIERSQTLSLRVRACPFLLPFDYPARERVDSQWAQSAGQPGRSYHHRLLFSLIESRTSNT
jgi:hypothetical protein